MWNRLRFIRFLQVSQIFQRRKSDTNKQDFENKLNLTCHAQSAPKTTGFLTKVFSTSGPNLVALAWTVDELSREQAQNGVNFDFEVKFDLEGQGQSPPKTIGILTKVFYTYGPNLVILAWTGDELSRGQTWWRTDWRTDGRTQATTIPEGQYWPRVKIITHHIQHFTWLIIYWAWHTQYYVWILMMLPLFLTLYIFRFPLTFPKRNGFMDADFSHMVKKLFLSIRSFFDVWYSALFINGMLHNGCYKNNDVCEYYIP